MSRRLAPFLAVLALCSACSATDSVVTTAPGGPEENLAFQDDESPVPVAESEIFFASAAPIPAVVLPGTHVEVRFGPELALHQRSHCWTVFVENDDGSFDDDWMLTTPDMPGEIPAAFDNRGRLQTVCSSLGLMGEGPDRLLIPEELTGSARICQTIWLNPGVPDDRAEVCIEARIP